MDVNIATFAAALACVSVTSTPTLALAQVPPPAGSESAQPAPEAELDEVRLHSGGFLKGEIVEYMPGEYLVIVPRGSTESRRIEWTQVNEVIRGGQSEGPTQPPAGVPGGVPTDTQPQPQPQVEPEPEPEPQVEPEPEPEGMPIHVEQLGGKEPLILYHIDGEAVAAGGGYTAHAVAFSEVCTSPCDGTLLDSGGEFFLASDKYRGSKRFRLPMRDSGGYELRAKPGSKGLAIGGYVLAISAPVAAVFMAVGPFLVDMPKTRAIGVWAGAGIVGAAGLAGGITMMVFSRTKVEVLPAFGG